MNDHAQEETHLGRPKLRFCALASVLWVFPSAGALFIVVPAAPRWFQSAGVLQGLRAVMFEQWIALVIVFAHLVFIWLAWHYRRTESLRE
jgi:hypothetical protein